MKKNLKTLIAAFVILLLLAGGYFLAVKWEPKKENTEENEQNIQATEYIINEETDNIEYVRFNNPEFSYTLRNGEKVTVEGYSSYVLDESSLTSALYNVATVVKNRTIKSSEDLSAFGLDKEDKSIEIGLKDGSVKKIILGNSANFDGEYYAKVGDEICTVSSRTAEAILKNPDLYRSLEICTIEPTQIKEFSVLKGNTALLSISYDEENSNSEVGMPAYKMTKPYAGITASSDKVNALLEKLTSLTATEIVSEGEKNLSQYGLDNPYVLTLKCGDETITLKLGSYGDDSLVYVMNADIPVVYAANCPFYESIKEVKAEEFIDRLIHIFNIESVKSIVIEEDGKKDELKIQKKGEDSYKYTLNSTHMAENNFKTLYQKIIGVPAAKFVNEKAEGKEKCTITFSFNDGTKKSFKYFIYDERYSVVKADNGMTCLTLTKNIDEISTFIKEKQK